MLCAASTVEAGGVGNQASSTTVGMAVGFSLAGAFVVGMVITFVVITVVLRRRSRTGKYVLRQDKIQGNISLENQVCLSDVNHSLHNFCFNYLFSPSTLSCLMKVIKTFTLE